MSMESIIYRSFGMHETRSAPIFMCIWRTNEVFMADVHDDLSKNLFEWN